LQAKNRTQRLTYAALFAIIQDMNETVAPGSDPFEALMAQEFGPTAFAADPDAAPAGFEDPISLTEEEINAAVAQFSADFNHDDLTDQRFSTADNEFLEQHGITSRHMTVEELQAYEMREMRINQAMLASEIMVRSILGDITVGDDKKKSRTPLLSLVG
jgi:hypothetical protein